MQTGLEDSALVSGLRNPETREQAFRELVRTYQERLYWQIRRIVLDHDDADDVLQETFIKIHRHIGGFKEESSLFSWMYRIATNEALTHLRSKARRRQISDSEYVQEQLAALPSDPWFDGDQAQLKLQQALARLPEKQKTVFNMKYFDDLKYEEISEILGTSVGALKTSYHLAVKKINDFMSN